MSPEAKPRPASRADLQRRQKGVLATGPSGAVYRIRRPNTARHLRAGGLTPELRSLALRVAGARSNEELTSMLTEEDLDQILAAQSQNRDWVDRLVLATVLEPALSSDDLGSGEIEDDDALLPAVDYDWLAAVAQGQESRDAEGRMLWGPEPLHRMEVFQRHHDCDPETCKGCHGVVEEFTAVMAASA